MRMDEEITSEDMLSQPTPDFNVFIGSETGMVKGVSINPKMSLSKNFLNMHHLERKDEITAMAWGDEDEDEILLGLRGHVVRTFQPEDKTVSTIKKFDVCCGKVVGVARANDALVTACESGVIQIWKDPKEKINTIDYELENRGKLKANNFEDDETRGKHLVSLKIEKALQRMRQVPQNINQVATGGKEHDLQLWDLTRLDGGPIFRAKNVPHDNLELRVPIWVTDVCFPDNQSSNQLAVVSRYGHIRLYDTRGTQRRPILGLNWLDECLTAVSSTPLSHEIIVGTATGFIGQYDLRMSHKGLRSKYRGCTGGIRSINCHKKYNYFAAVGLDRFLRIFDINQPKPVHKMYLKSRLNHVLLSKDFVPEALPHPEQKKKPKKNKETESKKKEVDDANNGDELFWTKLPVIMRSDSKKKGKKRGWVVKKPGQEDIEIGKKKKAHK